jgi:hypothetical protein
MHLERSAVPLGPESLELEIPEFISDIILIQGKVKNFHKSEVYTAPCLLPRSCVHIVKVSESFPLSRPFVSKDSKYFYF